MIFGVKGPKSIFYFLVLLGQHESIKMTIFQLVTEIEEIRQKFEATQNSLEGETRQLSQANEDIDGLKAKVIDMEGNVHSKEATLKTTNLLHPTYIFCLLFFCIFAIFFAFLPFFLHFFPFLLEF